MKLFMQAVTLVMLAGWIAGAQAQMVEVAVKQISASSISAFPKASNSPISLKPEFDNKFSVSADVFLSTCGLVTLHMDKVSQAEALSTVNVLTTENRIEGSVIVSDHFIRNETRCAIVRHENFQFFINGCAAPLQGRLANSQREALSASACDQLLIEFQK